MKKVLKIALFILLGVLVIGTFVFLYRKSRPVQKTYQIETVTQGTIEKKTVATGKVEPRNEIFIKPQMSGIISEVYKEAGIGSWPAILSRRFRLYPIWSI